MGDRSSFVMLSLVAIVAIVALVVLVNLPTSIINPIGKDVTGQSYSKSYFSSDDSGWYPAPQPTTVTPPPPPLTPPTTTSSASAGGGHLVCGREFSCKSPADCPGWCNKCNPFVYDPVNNGYVPYQEDPVYSHYDVRPEIRGFCRT